MFKKAFAAGGALLLSGCATIIIGQSQSLSIQSAPDAANVTVTNRSGVAVHSGTTPMTVTLKRGAGYFRSEVYTLAFSKPGYVSRELKVTSNVSGWYFGNIIFGGLLGMLAVDPATGAMYVFPETVQGNLQAGPASAGNGERTLTIVSTSSLTPEQLRTAMPVLASN